MIEKIHFILHVVNGIYIIKYTYTYSYANKGIIICILVQILCSNTKINIIILTIVLLLCNFTSSNAKNN